jgi:hypothetical protein
MFSERDFNKPARMLSLYPLRYQQGLSQEQLVELASLCDEVRLLLNEVVIQNKSADLQSAHPAFMALIEERLLCCTGDPFSRLSACWDRRPRGTFLDFGWSRRAPQIPNKWNFFQYFSPITLTSILIEVMEAVKLRSAEADALHIASPSGEGWKTVTAGDVLSRCYSRNALVRPDENDFNEYLKHVFFVLAAVETTNIFFKSPRVDLQCLETLFSHGRREVSLLLSVPLASIIEGALLSTPHSDLDDCVLINRGVHSGDTELPRHVSNDVFSPAQLSIQTLLKLGNVRIVWTEILENHLSFDSSSSTLQIYWFSHLLGRKEPISGARESNALYQWVLKLLYKYVLN